MKMHFIQLVICTLTSLAFIFPLRVVLQGRRHFEVFIGVGQLVTSVLYNICENIEDSIVLEGRQWHAMNNIFSTTYGILLLIHLQANHSEGFDMFLRYVAFGSIWIAQERDHYWDAKNTAAVAIIFIILTLGKWTFLGKLPPYNWVNVLKGLVIISTTAFFWIISMMPGTDSHGVLHGISQIGAAVSLRYFPFSFYQHINLL